MITKEKMDLLVKKYEVANFIGADPISIPHRFKDKKDIEISAFIASLIAYGSRKVFLKKLDELFKIAQNEPLNFILNFEPEILGDFNYRFGKVNDFSEVFKILRHLYEKDGGLEELFKYGYANPQNNSLSEKWYNMLSSVSDYFYSRAANDAGQGFYFMIPHPKNGGAMKRMCMYLRWMVRKPPVDFGIWDFIPKSELLIPLDVHVARVSREMGLLSRKQNDFKAVLELSETLRTFDPEDPSKYDFAMFGYGVDSAVNKNF